MFRCHELNFRVMDAMVHDVLQVKRHGLHSRQCLFRVNGSDFYEFVYVNMYGTWKRTIVGIRNGIKASLSWFATTRSSSARRHDCIILIYIVRSNLMKYITTLLGHREQNSIRNISFYDERRRKVWQKFLNKMSNWKFAILRAMWKRNCLEAILC